MEVTVRNQQMIDHRQFILPQPAVDVSVVPTRVPLTRTIHILSNIHELYQQILILSFFCSLSPSSPLPLFLSFYLPSPGVGRGSRRRLNTWEMGMFPEASVTVPSKSLMSPSATTECPCCRASAINFAKRRKDEERERAKEEERKREKAEERERVKEKRKKISLETTARRVLICILPLLSLPSPLSLSSSLLLTPSPHSLSRSPVLLSSLLFPFLCIHF